MTDIKTDTDSARVRSEIDDTREHLGQTVEAIGDRVLPGRIIERKKETTANSLRGLRDRIMGTAHDARDQLADSAGSTADHLRDVPESLAQRTEGSPLAAGGVAFAIGFLAAAVWRPTATERQVVEKAQTPPPNSPLTSLRWGVRWRTPSRNRPSEPQRRSRRVSPMPATQMKTAATGNTDTDDGRTRLLQPTP